MMSPCRIEQGSGGTPAGGEADCQCAGEDGQAGCQLTGAAAGGGSDPGSMGAAHGSAGTAPLDCQPTATGQDARHDL